MKKIISFFMSVVMIALIVLSFTSCNSSISNIQQAAVGDIVVFGSYPNKTSGEDEPIEWIVIDKYDDGARLLSKKVFEQIKYSYDDDMFSYLNHIFCMEAFDDSELKYVASDIYGKTNVTELLHDYDAKEIFSSNEERIGYSFDDDSAVSWWLDGAYVVKPDGEISEHSYKQVSQKTAGIRPVIRVYYEAQK